jgi:Domain of unknown function (DUF4167)
MKRSRGRNRRSGGSNQNSHNNPNRHYESVGPDVKIRGSAQQVLDKYQQYARDAQTSGDRILSEAYYQFAEHYQRIVAKQLESKERSQQQRNQNRDTRRDDRDDNDGNDNTHSDSDNSSKQEAEVESRNKRRDEDDRSDRNDDTSEESKSRSDDSSDRSESSDDSDDKAEKPRPRSRRKPYAKREKSDDAPEGETDGVLKTVSRGRRKAAPKGDDAAQAEAAPAETTD